jgi:formylglycine-generating enzyme required for sulfatase activity
VPLGPDPSSSLEEFWLFGSSERAPTRSGPNGELELHDESGLVLVLVPGGQCWIGAQSLNPAARLYDPLAPKPGEPSHNEGPPLLVQLDPYFISKYEFTQAQWTRVFGNNPSDFEVGSKIMNCKITPRNPVETISYEELVELLPRVGLVLPTEARWEAAARGGTKAPYILSAEQESLHGFANYREPGRPTFLEVDPNGALSQNDVHAPVGLGQPNGYGLFDVLGNVWEYCLDDYKVFYHTLEQRPGDGLVIGDGGGDYSRRGGGYGTLPYDLRVSIRQMRLGKQSDALTGVRPARSVQLSELPDAE